MPIKQKTPDSTIDGFFDEIITRLRKAIEYRLPLIGEELRNTAVRNGSYHDQTNNLRSSVGYVVVMDGRVLGGRFEREGSGSGGNGSAGVSAGEEYARSLAAKFPKGFVVIVVAGMRYASYVSARGYDVLDSAELIADGLIRKMLREIKEAGVK